MNTNTGCNGFTNYETWVTALFFNNDYNIYSYIQEIIEEQGMDKAALAEYLKEQIQEELPDLDGFLGDLLQHSIEQINYEELAEAIIE